MLKLQRGLFISYIATKSPADGMESIPSAGL